MANILTYLNIDSNDIGKQIELLDKLKQNQAIITTSLDQVNKLSDYSLHFKKNKIKIYLIDLKEEQLNINDKELLREKLLNIKEVINQNKNIPYEYLSLYLPVINDINRENEDLINYIKDYEKLATEFKIKFMIMPDKNNKATVMAYILKQKIDKRKFGISFNPHLINKSNYPISTAYRLLKNDIEMVVVDDYIGERSVLLGKGNLEYFDLFKKLLRDKYQNKIVLDINFTNFIVNFSHKKIKALFSKKERDLKQIYDWSYEQIKSNEVVGVIDYQLNLLGKIFVNK